MDRRNVLRALTAAAGASAASLWLAGCKPKRQQWAGMDISGAEYAKDFPLQDTQGHMRSVHEFAGKVVVVFFGYTQCPDVCPTTLAELAEAKQLLGALGDRLQGVFISVDPQRDTAEILHAYTQAFDPSLVALTGTPEQVAAVAKDFRVFFKKVPGRSEASYTVDHSAGLYMYDPQGRLRIYQRYGQGAQALAEDARVLLTEQAGGA